MNNILEKAKKNGAHFDARSCYVRELGIIVHPRHDQRPFVCGLDCLIDFKGKNPQELVTYLRDHPDILAAVLNKYHTGYNDGEILGLCVRTYLHITDCGLPDLNEHRILATKTHPAFSILWGVADNAQNGGPLLRLDHNRVAVCIDPDWGKCLILPPEENPTFAPLQKTA